ncbi:MAG: iron-sulfur cluster assembly protein, partial [Gammaproteobacteria bacterium]
MSSTFAKASTDTQNFDAESLKADVVQALRTVYDPEIPINIYELGLIYEITITPPGNVAIKMTLTTPNCPEAQTLPSMVESAARSVERVVDVSLELVWDPPWTK